MRSAQSRRFGVRRVHALVAIVAAVVSWCPTVSSAQERQPQAGQGERRPSPGLLGGRDPQDPPPALVVTASLSGAYDDNVFARSDAGRVGVLSPQRSGYFGIGQADVTYDRSSEVGSLGLAAGASVRYYPDVDSVTEAYQSRIQFSRKIGSSTTLAGGHAFSYAPHFRLTLFPGADGLAPTDTLALDPDADMFEQRTVQHSATLSLTQALGARTSLSFLYGARYTDFDAQIRDAQTKGDYLAQSGGARFSHRVTRYSTLVLGYAYREVGAASGGHPPAVHDVDVGVDYSRPLSFSRRTFVTLSSGSAIVANDRTGGTDARTRLRLTGQATLKHEMGRTWTADAGYRRGLTFQDGIDDPFFTDGVTAGLQGLLSRRLDVLLLAQWTHATFTTGERGYEALLGSAQLQYALSRRLGLFAKYSYCHYDFDARVGLSPQFTGAFDRGGVRVGISTNIPLVR